VPNRSQNIEPGLRASAFARSISDLWAKSAELTTRTRKLARDMADLAVLFTDEEALRVELEARRNKT
jgi:hypothetical protein